MAGAYGNLGQGRADYSSADIYREMQWSGYQQGSNVVSQTAPTGQVDYSSYSADHRGAAVDIYGLQHKDPHGVSMVEASTHYATQQHYSTGMCSASTGQSQQVADAYADYDPAVFAGLPPHMLDGATNVHQGEGRVISERLVETKQEFITNLPGVMFHSNAAADREAVRTVLDRVAVLSDSRMNDGRMNDGRMNTGGVAVAGSRMNDGRMNDGRMNTGGVAVAGIRPIYMMEKVVEVPHVITKEYDKHVPKPEIIERLIEVPKTEIRERTVQLPPTVQYQEQIVEVPEYVVEERVVHVPKKEIQERLIEVPKVRYVERIEYEDIIEYREVPVDRIVEVPEIEYRVREVEQLVPQEYIQEYYVDRYTDVPVTQIQEVERIEHIPVVVPPGFMPPPVAQYPAAANMSMSQAQLPAVANMSMSQAQLPATANPSMAHALKVSAGAASTAAPLVGASSLVSASFAVPAVGSTASAASAAGPAAPLPVPVQFDALNSVGSMSGPPTPPIPAYSGPCGGSSISVQQQSQHGTGPAPATPGLFTSSASLPPGGGSAAALAAAGLPVGSSFLVPRGTFPRGQMSAAQAAQAGLSMPPASGAFPPPPLGASVPSTMAAAASMPSIPGGYNPYDSVEPHPNAAGLPPPMTTPPMMTQPPMSQLPPLASAPFASGANPFQTGGAYPSYASLQAPVPAMA